MSLIGAYLFADTWRNWSVTEAQQNLKQLKEYGINTIFTEADVYDDRLIEQVHRLGMRFMGGLNCFYNNDILQHQPELHPILRDGQKRPQMNWYIGVSPTNEAYNHTRLDTLQKIITSHDVDGIWLDFIRFPLHWEQELRDDTPAPLESSFDSHTLNRFATYANINIPDQSTSEIVTWIESHQQTQWIDFKCSVITEFVYQVQQFIQASKKELPLGINIVPASKPVRERLLGQRLSDLAPYVDYVSPMLYHQILGKSLAWITDTLDQLAEEAHTKLLPYIQVKAFDKPANDFDTQEWEQLLHRVLSHPKTIGIIAFTGTSLYHHSRGEQLKNSLVSLNI